MNLGLQILASLSLWGVVGSIIYFIDPEIIKDYPIPGLYILFLASVMVAFAHTAGLIWRKRRWQIVATAIFTLGIALLLIL